jgi:hypothetical protein
MNRFSVLQDLESDTYVCPSTPCVHSSSFPSTANVVLPPSLFWRLPAFFSVECSLPADLAFQLPNERHEHAFDIDKDRTPQRNPAAVSRFVVHPLA